MASLILINILFVKMLNIFKKYFFDFFEKKKNIKKYSEKFIFWDGIYKIK
jgi:hypothetical protein